MTRRQANAIGPAPVPKKSVVGCSAPTTRLGVAEASPVRFAITCNEPLFPFVFGN